MINLDDVTVFNDLRDRLARVTPEQIGAAQRKMKSLHPKEEVIGIIEAQTTRALYALFLTLNAEVALEMAKAKGAIDETTEKDHKEKAAVLDMFEDVASEIFWTQAKLDLGFHEMESVSVRSGWTLVKDPRERGPSEFMAALMRGGLPPEAS